MTCKRALAFARLSTPYFDASIFTTRCDGLTVLTESNVVTLSECPGNDRIKSPLALSHNLTDRSVLPDTKVRPSGLKAILITWSV